MNNIKKFICFALALVVIMASSSVNVLAEETESTKRQLDDIERVLEEYYSAVSNVESTENNYVRKMAAKENLQCSAVQELNQLGYEAYVVNSDSYNDVERALGTDLESIGVNSEGSYIVVVHGDEHDDTISPRSTIGSSFTYKYNGSSYVLRYVTVSSNDNSMQNGASIKVNTSEIVTNSYSSRYFDSAWKKENAVIGFLNSYTISDRTGTISYTYNGNVLFSHAENF